jgi:hypothetical protein
MEPGHDSTSLTVSTVGVPDPVMPSLCLCLLLAGLGARMLLQQFGHGGLSLNLAQVLADLS